MLKSLGLCRSALMFCTALVPSLAQAVTPVIEAGLYAGGDELVDVQFVNAPSQSIDAGGLIDLSAGLLLPVSDSVDAQLTLGYRFDTIDGSNGSIDWSRFPLEAKLFFNAQRSRFGLGVTYHLSPELEGSGIVSGRQAFEDAAGVVAEWDYTGWERGYLGLKFTAIDYEVGTLSVNGNSLGLVLGYRFSP